MRVLKWIVERAHGTRVRRSRARSAGCRATRTSTGAASSFSTRQQFDDVMSIDRDVVAGRRSRSHDELFIQLYDQLPKELIFLRELILSSLWRSPEHWALEPE